MDVKDFKRLTRNFTEENILVNEEHVLKRCELRDVVLEQVTRLLLDQSSRLLSVSQLRHKVYRVRYGLSAHREIDVIVEFPAARRLKILTIYPIRNVSGFVVDKYIKEDARYVVND